MRVTGRAIVIFTISLLLLIVGADLAWLIYSFCCNIVTADQKEMIPLFAKLASHSLTWNDLWSQHNEHRILFPRLLLLLLGGITGRNVNYELGLSYGVALGTFALFLCLLARTGRQLGITAVPWVIPVLGVLHFSLTQCESWLFGMNLVIFLSVFAVVGGIIMLSIKPLRPQTFFAALVYAAVAAGSFANGLLFWFIGAAIIAVVHPRRRASLAAWLLCGAGCIGAYLTGYHRPVHHPLPIFPDEALLSFLRYLFTYLGSPVSASYPLIAGIAGTILLFSAIFLLARNGVAGRVSAPFAALAAYAFGSAALTAMGRTGFGVTQALSGRYITISSLLWVAVCCLLYILAELPSARPAARALLTAPAPLLRAGAVLIVLLILVLTAQHSLGARPQFSAHYREVVELGQEEARLSAIADDIKPGGPAGRF